MVTGNTAWMLIIRIFSFSSLFSPTSITNYEKTIKLIMVAARGGRTCIYCAFVLPDCSTDISQ